MRDIPIPHPARERRLPIWRMNNEFSARLPSAVFGILSCVTVCLLGMALFGRRAGLFSGLVLAASLLFTGGFRLIMTDPSFVFFTTLAFLFYVFSDKNIFKVSVK